MLLRCRRSYGQVSLLHIITYFTCAYNRLRLNEFLDERTRLQQRISELEALVHSLRRTIYPC